MDRTLEHIGAGSGEPARVSEARDAHIGVGTGFYREPYCLEFVQK